MIENRKIASLTPVDQPKKFTTYDRDGNGSDEAMFRRYNRQHSRFDQPDPYDGSYNLTDPQSLNRYAYSANDPANLTDPTGLYWITHQYCSQAAGGPWRCETVDEWVDSNDDITTSLALLGGGRVIDGGGGGTGPQNPTATPTSQQTPIYCRPDVIKAMNTAWSQSGNAGMGHPGSQPVEAGFNLNGTPSNYQVSGSFTNAVGKMTIK